MQQINEKSHYATIISSLSKEYNKAKLGQVLTPDDIYLLDIVYNLLQGCCLDLTDDEIKKLLQVYNNILYGSKVVCNNNYQATYQMTKKDKFIQAEKTDANNVQIVVPVYNIYYWQENSYIITNQEIIDNTYDVGFFNDKLYDTYANFENIGKTISYTNVGKIVFYAKNSNNKEFIITDILNNNVTNVFDIIYLTDKNSTIFISKSLYSYGDIFFKFTQTTLDDGIFSSEFNNIFI